MKDRCWTWVGDNVRHVSQRPHLFDRTSLAERCSRYVLAASGSLCPHAAQMMYPHPLFDELNRVHGLAESHMLGEVTCSNLTAFCPVSSRRIAG